jgi:nucleotide-binding universal stress UspA family protein
MANPHSSILVPLDGSEFAERAVATAAGLSAPAGGTLHLVTAVSPLPIFQPADPVLEETPGWFVEEGARARKYLEGVRGRLSESHPGLPVQIHAPVGRASSAILKTISDAGAELVVITTHGRGFLSRAWVGSVADRVMREASCGVLLLTGEEGSFDPSSVLVAMDGSATAEAALEEGARLARGGGGRLTLACVIPRPESVAVPYIDLSAETERMRMDREEEMKGYLERVAEPYRAEGLRVDVVTSRADEVTGGLLRLREQARAGVIAMGTQGRGGVARLLLGSVATRLVRTAPVPVLLVPPRTGR